MLSLICYWQWQAHSCMFIFITVFWPIKDSKSTYSHSQPAAKVPACHIVRLMRLENQIKTVAVFWLIIHIFYCVGGGGLQQCRLQCMACQNAISDVEIKLKLHCKWCTLGTFSVSIMFILKYLVRCHAILLKLLKNSL